MAEPRSHTDPLAAANRDANVVLDRDDRVLRRGLRSGCGARRLRYLVQRAAPVLALALVGCLETNDVDRGTEDSQPSVSAALEAELRAVFADATVAADTLRVAGTLESIAATAVEVADRLEPLFPGARQRADSVAVGVEFMLDLWTPSASLPDEYRRDLARNLRVLRLAASIEDADEAHLLWAEVMEDMEIKIEHCYALGTGLGGLVAVRAHTLRELAADSGWQVVYLRKVFEVLPDMQPQPFPRLSSPAEDSLAPGRYWIWARRPGSAATSERVLLRVGAGRSLVDVDLPLPASEP